MSNEAELFSKVQSDTGFKTNTPSACRITTIRFHITEVETTINKELNKVIVCAEISVTSIRVNREMVVSIFQPSIFNTCTNSPFFAKIITDFRSNGESIRLNFKGSVFCFYINSFVSIANRATYINLS